MFLAIVDQDEKGKLKKYQPYELESDAIIHMEKYGGFVIADPGGNKKFWTIDPIAKTITVDSDAEALQKLIKTRNRLYELANTEYIKRSLIAAENLTPGIGNIRGGNAKDQLMLIFAQANATDDSIMQSILVSVLENFNSLKDIIEITYDQFTLDSFNVEDNTYWSID